MADGMAGLRAGMAGNGCRSSFAPGAGERDPAERVERLGSPGSRDAADGAGQVGERTLLGAFSWPLLGPVSQHQFPERQVAA